MSGRAQGWVHRHGPKRRTIAPDGKPYGARARGLSAVLLVIADAANHDGEHAYPGLPSIVELSDYSRRQVIALLGVLVTDGWLIVEEEGGGRGKSTMYRIPGVAGGETVRPSHALFEPNGATGDAKGCTPERETVQSPADAHLSSTTSTSTNLPAGKPPKPTDDPRRRAAHKLTTLAFEQPVKPTVAGGNGRSFVAVLDLFDAALNAGRTVQEIERAIVAGIDVWTTQGLNTALARQRRRPGKAEERERSYDVLGDRLARGGPK